MYINVLIFFIFTSAEFGPFSSVWTATIARVGAFFRIFRDLQNEHSFAPLESKWKKPWKNHPVDTIEKAENAESSENITNKRYENYITPNNRLTIFVQQSAANTRLTQKLRMLQRRQSEQHKFANFSNFLKFQRVQRSRAVIFAECSGVYSGTMKPIKSYRNQRKLNFRIN